MVRDPLIIRLEGNPQPRPRRRPYIPLMWFVVACCVIVIIAGTTLLLKYVMNGNEGTTEELGALVGDVGLLMLLPSDEQPTIATVTNLEAIKDQPFFKNAKLGDVVLMYPKAGRAILYSPEENMIIEVAPIVLDAP